MTLCRKRNGKLSALLPLYVSRRWPLRVARFIGHGPADQLGPLCRQVDRTSIAIALRRTLSDVGCQVLFGDTLHGGERWSQYLGADVYSNTSNPVLRLEWSSWDDYLDSRTANFNIERRANRGVSP